MNVTVTDQLTAYHCFVSSRICLESVVVTLESAALGKIVCSGLWVKRAMVLSNTVGKFINWQLTPNVQQSGKRF